MDTLDRHELQQFEEAFCPYYQQAIELIGRKWTGVILRAQLHGILRFSELKAAIPALSDRMLSERLKELEAEGLVVRRVIPDTPVRVEYLLTTKGRALGAVVEAISNWADQWLKHRPEVAQTETGDVRS